MTCSLPRSQAICGEAGLKKYHEQLLDAYTHLGKVPLNEVADDGYIVQVGGQSDFLLGQSNDKRDQPTLHITFCYVVCTTSHSEILYTIAEWLLGSKDVLAAVPGNAHDA
eukprot:scaffold146026_cov17-Tisochrysis_lutea.AAC.1